MAVTIDVTATTAHAEGALRRLKEGATSTFDTIQVKMRDSERVAERTASVHSRSFERMEQAASRLAARFTAGFGLVQLARSFLDNALAMDRTRQSLEAVTGSQQAAAREMQFLQGIAQRTGTGIATVAQQWTGLFAAVNQVPGRLEVTRTLFTALIETAARAGKSTEQVGLALYGLTQILGGATVQLQDFNQLIDAVPGILPAFARELGVTQQELREMIGQGRVLVDDTLPAMERAIRSLSRADGPITTATAEFGRMATAWTNLMDALAQAGALGLVTKGVQGLTAAFNLFRQGVEGFQFRLGINLSEVDQINRRLFEVHQQMTRLANAMRALEKIEGFDFSQMEEQMRELNEEAIGLQQRLQQLTEPPPPTGAAPPPAGPSEAELKAAAERFKAQEGLLSASLKRQQADVQRHYDEQRRMLEQFYQEQLQEQPRQLEALQRQRESDLQALARQEAQRLAEIARAGADERLRRQLHTINAEIAAAKGAADKIAALEGEKQIAIAEHAAAIADIRKQLAAFEVKESERATDQRIKDLDRELDAQKKQAELLESVRQQGLEDFARQTERLHEEMEREQQRALEQQEREYLSFADRVTDRLAGVLEDFLSGTLDALQFFRRLVLSTISQLIAEIALRPIIVPLIAGTLAGVAGALAPSAGAAILRTAGLGGGVAQAAGATGGLGGTRDLLGLAAIGSMITRGIGGFMNALDTAATAIVGTFSTLPQASQAALESALVETGAGITPVGTLGRVSGLQFFGGLAGLGGGIFQALTARTLSGQIGGALGAAGGATALAAALAPALGLSLAPILGPIGLAISALAPLLGGFLGLGAPRGPRLALGRPTGLAVGVQDGLLALQGQLTIGTLQRSGVSREAANQMQDAMANAITTAVQSMVGVLNQLALDPAALVGPANEALREMNQRLIPLQSSSAKNMQRDIEEQLKLIPVQLGVFFLNPLRDAFGQLRSRDVEIQLTRLPQAVGQLGQFFTQLNQQLDELAKVQNRDVLGRLPELRGRLQEFRRDIVEISVQVASQVVDAVGSTLQETMPELLSRSLEVQVLSLPGRFAQPLRALGALQATQAQLGAIGADVAPIRAQIERLVGTILDAALTVASRGLQQGAGAFPQALQVILALPQAVTALNPLLAQVQQLAQAFAPLVGALSQDIATLEAAVTPLADQLSQTVGRIEELRGAIADAGGDVSVALPLFDALRQAILREANLRIELLRKEAESTRTLEETVRTQDRIIGQARGLIDQLRGQAREGLVPAARNQLIQQELLRLQARLSTETGEAALSTIAEMQQLFLELQRLGETSHNLALIAQAQQGLAGLIPAVEAQLAAAEAQKSVAEQQLGALQTTAQIDEAIRQIQLEALDQLRALQAELHALFVSNQAVQQSLSLPIPVVIAGQAAQRGGVIHAQEGRRIPAMLEPGESLWLPPLTRAQQGELLRWNALVPRFGFGGIVPGFGSGDIVPALLPPDTVVVNRKATQALFGGDVPRLPRASFQTGGVVRRQEGGTVQPSGKVEVKEGDRTVHVTIHVHNPVIRDDGDIRKLATELERYFERQTRSGFGVHPRRKFP